ncbi:unnamed protein product [Rangifer tarandus platyrhynchus]|uniref:Uncharacterized protein n=1 Tax=Rangifer tarandus platyrhynchus TaxID=3082113 RepID=A0ABN9A9H3_RANTA|nr:unnamed protein product [Rangifer tarandus platyrhynchus]
MGACMWIHMHATPSQPPPVVKVVALSTKPGEPHAGGLVKGGPGNLGPVPREHSQGRRKGELWGRVLSKGTRLRSPPGGTIKPSLPSVRVTCDSYHHQCLHPKAPALSHPH